MSGKERYTWYFFTIGKLVGLSSELRNKQHCYQFPVISGMTHQQSYQGNMGSTLDMQFMTL